MVLFTAVAQNSKSYNLATKKACKRFTISFSALDASTAAGILRLLVKAVEKGASVVIASHDQPMLNAICHRALSMRDGRLVAQAPR